MEEDNGDYRAVVMPQARFLVIRHRQKQGFVSGNAQVGVKQIGNARVIDVPDPSCDHKLR